MTRGSGLLCPPPGHLLLGGQTLQAGLDLLWQQMGQSHGGDAAGYEVSYVTGIRGNCGTDNARTLNVMCTEAVGDW